jgi:coenzyme F420-0:L-glutamate ligase
MDQRLGAIVLEEADRILGGVRGFLLTVKNGILTANAGIDLKNCPPGTAILWPKNADRSAALLRKRLEKRYSARLGVIVVDSRVTAMRLGTVGLAIGVSGLAPVSDHRGTSDIYGRKAKITQTNVADDLASSAHLLMGETNQRIGVVIARGVPVSLRDVDGSRRARLNATRCLIARNIASARKLS